MGRGQFSNIEPYAAGDEGLIEDTRCRTIGKDDKLLREIGHIAKAGSPLVVWPEVFTIWIKQHGTYRVILPTALWNCGGRGVQVGKEEFDEVGFAETGAGEDKRPPGHEVFDVESRHDGGTTQHHPGLYC